MVVMAERWDSPPLATTAGRCGVTEAAEPSSNEPKVREMAERVGFGLLLGVEKKNLRECTFLTIR